MASCSLIDYSTRGTVNRLECKELFLSKNFPMPQYFYSQEPKKISEKSGDRAAIKLCVLCTLPLSKVSI